MSSDRVYYAIGDVHGEAESLRRLHDAVFERHRSMHAAAPMTIVHLGDFVDRGPDSRAAVETVLALTERAAQTGAFQVVNMRGNHEQLMIDAVLGEHEGARRLWFANGGEATVASYRAGGAEAGSDQEVLEAHARWMDTLPTLFRDEGRRLAFVHAGVDPAVFPDCDDQVRLWTRSQRFFREDAWPDRPELEGILIVHGHSPTDDFRPDVRPRRINVDTGACYGGALTAVVLAPDGEPDFLRVERSNAA